MTENERKRVVLQAARNARRVYRRADSAGERLERWLDREINRKTRIRAEQALKVEPLWNAYKDSVNAIARALADFLGFTENQE